MVSGQWGVVCGEGSSRDRHDGALGGLVGFGATDQRSPPEAVLGWLDVGPSGREQLACPQGGVVGDQDHGGLEVAAAPGLLGCFWFPAGLVVSGFSGCEGDPVDVVLSQWVCLPGARLAASASASLRVSTGFGFLMARRRSRVGARDPDCWRLPDRPIGPQASDLAV